MPRITYTHAGGLLRSPTSFSHLPLAPQLEVRHLIARQGGLEHFGSLRLLLLVGITLCPNIPPLIANFLRGVTIESDSAVVTLKSQNYQKQEQGTRLTGRRC